MVFHPAGSAGTWGAVCAPREAFVHQVCMRCEICSNSCKESCVLAQPVGAKRRHLLLAMLQLLRVCAASAKLANMRAITTTQIQMQQVLTSYEEGVYNILFDSIPDEELRPEWRRAAAARVRTVGGSEGVPFSVGACSLLCRREGGVARAAARGGGVRAVVRH